MSSLGCVCGHRIADQADNIPYKATFIRDEDLVEHSNKYSNEIASFIEAIKDGKRDEWIKNYFSEQYPVNLKDSVIVFDILSHSNRTYNGELFQCESCGRIKIQVQNQNLFASFKPEDENYKEILKKFQ